MCGKENNECWYSEGFYTGIGCYKVRLLVFPNGVGNSKSTHLSVYINLMPGAVFPLNIITEPTGR